MCRPHSGEAGDVDHLAAAFLTAESVNHGITMRRTPALQYLYYLTQVCVYGCVCVYVWFCHICVSWLCVHGCVCVFMGVCVYVCHGGVCVHVCLEGCECVHVFLGGGCLLSILLCVYVREVCA